MKIRWSLRLYVLVVVLLTGIVTIFSFSGLSLKYFFTGMDIVMERVMISEAHYTDVSDGHPVEKRLNDHDGKVKDIMVVASRWEDLPEQVRDDFEPEKLKLHELNKKLTGGELFRFEPPKKGNFVLKTIANGELRYVATYFVADKKHLKIGPLPHILIVMVIALAFIVLFTVVLGFILRTVSSPVERLKNWAKTIDEKDLKRDTPDFDYRELNTLAAIIRSSFRSVHESAEREKRFLGFASHELRTPIAVTRTNSELLRKLIEKQASKEKQLAVVERIERAGLTMTDLTETLLWLNRQEDKSLPLHEVQLGHLIKQINYELEFLIKGKQVIIDISTDDSVQTLPEVLCRIVVTNLLRNAMQHTNEGRVEVVQTGSSMSIINRDTQTYDSHELGFGLGLELTEKLIDKYGWQYRSQELEGGREVLVVFNHAEYQTEQK